MESTQSRACVPLGGILTCGHRSWNHVLTRGMSTERRVRPERLLKGCGAHSSPMPCAVLSVYRGVSSRKGLTPASAQECQLTILY